jgi:type II secretory pathway pseudopilin PulG
MNTRGRARALASVGVVVLAIAVVPSSVAAQAQQKSKKLDKAQQQEADALTQLLNQAQAGRQVPGDLPVSIEAYHYFKSATGSTYVPFTMLIDTTRASSPAVSVMLRVVKTNATAPAPAAVKAPGITTASDRDVTDASDVRNRVDAERTQAEGDKDKLPPLAPASFQDLYFVDVRSQEGQPGRLARAFQVEPGDYDVYVGVKERAPADKKKPKMAVCKQTFSLPNLAIPGDLTVSSVMLMSKTEELKQQLSIDQQREHPYAIGALEIVPAVGTKLAKTDQLQVFFQIYNYTLLQANKPDVLVEYNFYRKLDSGEKYFNKTEPDVLDAAHLNPIFDGTKHQLSGGVVVPLEKIPVGTYRLEIKVTDKPSGKSLTRSLEFSVS